MPRILPILALPWPCAVAHSPRLPPPRPRSPSPCRTPWSVPKPSASNSSPPISPPPGARRQGAGQAALLPSVNWNTASSTPAQRDRHGIFVANNGPRVYTNMANVHGDVYAPGKRADYQMAIAAEAIARAKVEIAARGLTAVVVQNFYTMAVAQRHYNNARRSLQESQQFVDITQKQEAGGRGRHSDVVKAQLTPRSAPARRAGRATGLRQGRALASPSSSSRIFARISPSPTISTASHRSPPSPKSKRWPRKTNPTFAPRRPPSPSRTTASRAPAPATCRPSPWIIFTASTPTSTRCTTNSARTTWALAWWPASTSRCGPGARRAAR